MDDLVDLIWNEHSGSDHGQVLGPASAHRKTYPFGAFEQRVDDCRHRDHVQVGEVADIDEQLEQELDEEAVADVEVQLVLCVVGPAVEPTFAIREKIATASAMRTVDLMSRSAM